MSTATVCGPNSPLPIAIARDGFAFVRSRAMRLALAQFGGLDDWDQFKASWNALEIDTFMADGGRYRRRRHAVYTAGREGTIARGAHQPHFQATDYNPLNGGIERWFEPVSPDVASGPTLMTILAFCRTLFGSLSPDATAWHIEVHQFRIEARAGEQGRPTPEGLHRDGVDYVLALLVDRENIASGTTTVHGLDRQPLGAFTLTDSLDSALLEDARVYHGVTPVEPIDPSRPAHRDVLVATFAARTHSVS